MSTPYVLRIHYDLPAGGHDLYTNLLTQLEDFTPRVQPVEPASADCEIGGAQSYFRRSHREIAQLIQLRALAHYGVRTAIGGGRSPMIAAMAADSTALGAVTCIDPDPQATERWLRPRPLITLYGAGPATVRTLSRYGLTTIGQLADTPLVTVQKILGAAGRLLHERSHGIDPRTVTRQEPARSCSAEYRFPRDELDAHQHRRALLQLCEQIGFQLRDTDQAARRLALTVRYSDQATTQRTRMLPEATNHSAALTHTAYDMLEALGLQRARVTGIGLRGEVLTPAETTHHQLTFDPSDDRARKLEAAADRARARYGPDAVHPATLAGRARAAETPPRARP
ncbi:hypothetical protein AB0N09_27905 [Streptomyces erythrochromogenes]|uniref:DNA polymerase Y family protein n=1 Tax=Streptomyces erythrochromogenes TaxID=285574 RepID=UPI00342602A7